MTGPSQPVDAPAAALTAADLHKSFGGTQAVNGASFDVPAGVITAMIGPNGAGKTTIVNLLSGALRPDAGSVSLRGRNITKLPPFRRAQAGLIRTFQLSREFEGLTVLENLLAACPDQPGESLLNVFFRPRMVRRSEDEFVDRAFETLATYGLYRLRDSWAGELSGGQKRLLELARAVMAKPTVLLLDEPMAGINPALIGQIGEHIQRLKSEGVSVLMVEHNLNVVEQICDHVIVLAEGRTLATGLMSDLRANPEVVQAYLGGVLDARARR